MPEASGFSSRTDLTSSDMSKSGQALIQPGRPQPPAFCRGTRRSRRFGVRRRSDATQPPHRFLKQHDDGERTEHRSKGHEHALDAGHCEAEGVGLSAGEEAPGGQDKRRKRPVDGDERDGSSARSVPLSRATPSMFGATTRPTASKSFIACASVCTSTSTFISRNSMSARITPSRTPRTAPQNFRRTTTYATDKRPVKGRHGGDAVVRSAPQTLSSRLSAAFALRGAGMAGRSKSVTYRRGAPSSIAARERCFRSTPRSFSHI